MNIIKQFFSNVMSPKGSSSSTSCTTLDPQVETEEYLPQRYVDYIDNMNDDDYKIEWHIHNSTPSKFTMIDHTWVQIPRKSLSSESTVDLSNYTIVDGYIIYFQKIKHLRSEHTIGYWRDKKHYGFILDEQDYFRLNGIRIVRKNGKEYLMPVYKCPPF